MTGLREHTTGLELFVDPNAMKESGIEQAMRRLADALAVLDLRAC